MPIPTAKLISRFDVPGPGYTSYPTADRFVEAFSAEQLAQMLAQRCNGAAALTSSLAVYVHIPFCASLCYYCNCTKVITRDHERGKTYLRYLSRELALYTAHLGCRQALSEVHLGGGSPTFLRDEELDGLMSMLRRSFKFAPDGDYSIEVDPRTVDASRLARLEQLGFNHMSFGVQDFDPAVQKAVHRIQPAAGVVALVEAARALGLRSINVDLMYGLPQQTPESFDRTLAKVCALKPDRIALYAYTHLPARFKPQRRIAAAELPVPAARASMLSGSLGVLRDAGYVYVGLDHFALPHDQIAVAKRQGRLHRNLHGYSSHPDCDVLGLGMSAFGKIGVTYSQNAKTLEEYYDHLDQARLPVARGLALSRDDLVRRAVIMALLCQGQLDFESIELSYLVDFARYFAAELQTLAAMEKQRLVEISDTGIEVTTMGLFFVRGVAMVFDRYLQADRTRARFSRII